MRTLVLLTDAYGGHGGIAKFNRDMLRALCAYPSCEAVIALARLGEPYSLDLPPRLEFRAESRASKVRYVRNVVQSLARGERFDAIICAHIHLLPLAALSARWARAPLVLLIHGIEAWRPPKGRLIRRAIRYVDAVVAVSAFTRDRFLEWAGSGQRRSFILPDCVEIECFGVGPKPAYLLDRYDLHGRKVILTVGRISSKERYKGHDEVLQILPSLVRETPELRYVIVGDGDDRPRLERKVANLRMHEHVIFTGYIDEAEKADHYRIADAFVMPGRGEGFGIVYLEAMACGVPVVASSLDASSETLSSEGLAYVVDPDDSEKLKDSIKEALAEGERRIPPGLWKFAYERFEAEWHRLMSIVLGDALSLAGDAAYGSRTVETSV